MDKLIEKLVEETGCDCLSNLRLQRDKWIESIIEILSEAKAEEYTLDEWKETASYLADIKCDTIESPEQIKQCLLSALKND